MAKALEDFRVIINLGGLHLRGRRPFQQGQIIQGVHIKEDLLELLKSGRTFLRGGDELPVCALLEGKVEDLEEALSKPQHAKPFISKPAPPPEPKPGDPGIVVVETPKPKDEKPSVEVKNLEVKDGVKTGTSTAKPAKSKDKKKDDDK